MSFIGGSSIMFGGHIPFFFFFLVLGKQSLLFIILQSFVGYCPLVIEAAKKSLPSCLRIALWCILDQPTTESATES